jgi:methionyl-tRNA formyltransferase
MPKRLVFLGTPEIAVGPLRALHEAGHDVALVVTQPDRRRGRGSATSPSPVKSTARALGIPVSHDVDDALTVGAELGVVVAYGRLIKPHVLAVLPMVNVHFSLLPRWRGAAPVERALLAGDTETGVCIMAVEEALDTGDVYAKGVVPINDSDTADDLRRTLVDIGTDLLLDVVAGDLPKPEPQSGEPTYAEKFKAEEWALDWTAPATQLGRWVRAGQAWTTFRGKRLRVLSAAVVDTPTDVPAPAALAEDGESVGTGSGALRLGRVQPEGRGPMSWRDFANGAQPKPGELLGERGTDD